MRGYALQTFKNINGPTRENLGETLAVFRKKEVKPQSMAAAKHNFQKLVFNPANQKLVEFLDELQKPAIKNWNSCPCHRGTVYIRQKATAPEKINKSGPLAEWHV